jgi:hypothetical protein
MPEGVGRRRTVTGVVLLCLALSVSCRGRSPAAELKSEMEAVSSWAATAQMVGEEWARGAVPAAYARRTLRSARETFGLETETINGLPAVGQELRTESLGRLQELEQSVARMEQGVERDDRGRVEEEVGRLKAARESLRAALEKLDEGGR